MVRKLKAIKLKEMVDEYLQHITPMSDEQAEALAAIELEADINKKLDSLALSDKLRYFVFDGFDKSKYPTSITTKLYHYNVSKFCKEINKNGEIVKLYGIEKGFLFWGMSGIGKSVLMGRLAKNLVEQHNVPCKWIDCVKFGVEITRLKQTFGDIQGYLLPYINIDNLFLDDVSNDKITKEGVEAMGTLIHLRDGKLGKTTFATANSDINHLAGKLGVPTASRIKGMCKIIKIESETDWR